HDRREPGRVRVLLHGAHRRRDARARQPDPALLGDVVVEHPPPHGGPRADRAARPRGEHVAGKRDVRVLRAGAGAVRAARAAGMNVRLLRPLDRYVLSEFLRILAATALGFPVLVIVIDVTDSLQKYMARRLPLMDIA